MVKLYGNFGIQLIELEQTVDKIVSIAKSVPSEYARGKSKLDEVRAELADRNMRKAQKLANAALDIYREESVVASEYNRVVKSFNYNTPTLTELKRVYSLQLSDGDLEGARKTVAKISDIRPLDVREVKQTVAVEVQAGSGGTVIKISNSGSFEIYITRIEAYGNGAQLRTDRGFPFVIDAGSTFMVQYSPAEGPVTGYVNYDQNGYSNSIEFK